MFLNANRVFLQLLINLIVVGSLCPAFAQDTYVPDTSCRTPADYSDAFLRSALGNFIQFMESDIGTSTIILTGIAMLIAVKMHSHKVAIGFLVVFWGLVLIRVLIHCLYGMPYDTYSDG